MSIRLERANVFFGEASGLHDLSLTIRRGDCGVITGPSGAGKSTLLKVLAGFQPIHRGSVSWRPEPTAEPTHEPTAEPTAEPTSKPTLIWQNPKLMDHRSTLANLLLPLQIKGDFRRGVARELAREALASVGLTAYEKTKAQKLSTGEKQRLSIARALIIKPDILLADEPTAHLDATWANRISALLLTAHRRGTTLLVATHETKLVDELNANLTIQLESGRIVALDYNPVDKRVERAQEASPYPQELKPVEVLS